MFLGSLKQIDFETKVYSTLHTDSHGLKKEGNCTMSDRELKCIQFWVCISILHFIQITEDWKKKKLFDTETLDFQKKEKCINSEIMKKYE